MKSIFTFFKIILINIIFTSILAGSTNISNLLIPEFKQTKIYEKQKSDLNDIGGKRSVVSEVNTMAGYFGFVSYSVISVLFTQGKMKKILPTLCRQ